MTALLLQPLGPFLLAIGAGLMAGLVATTRGSVLAFVVIVLGAALLVAVLDLLANLRAPWGGASTDGEGGVPLVHVVWELLTANVVVIGAVGAAVCGVSLVLR